MNIHPSRTNSKLAPAEWTMEFAYESLGGVCQTICIIFRSEVEMCRLSTTHKDCNRNAADLESAQKARAWIADYVQRSEEEARAAGRCDCGPA
ncbi:MAG: hypothetical protein JSS56_22915 [Proteobacteria bacterium]|nr:hypothetical protein [Pseudomonadota bacterium]